MGTFEMYRSGFLNEILYYLNKNKIKYEIVDKKNGRLIEIYYHNKNIFFGASPISLWPCNSQMSSSIVKDKELTLRICKDLEIKTPNSDSGVVSLLPYEHLKEKPPLIKNIAERFENKYIVIKPNDSKVANGLVFLYGKRYINEAIELASKFSNIITIQEQLFGTDYRYYIFNGEPIAKLKRPVSNNVLSKPEYVLSRKSFLEENGCLITDNPYRVSNFSINKYKPEIHTDFTSYEKEIFKKIFRKFAINFCAVDCIEKNSELCILELNSNPGVESLYTQDKNSIAYNIFENIIKLCLIHVA
jgi:D-alanine-D-alanine ligase-like ATP-grasp enzyme